MTRLLSLICCFTLCSTTFATVEVFRKFFDKNGHSKSNMQYVPLETYAPPMSQLQPQPNRNFYQTTAYNSYSNAAAGPVDPPKSFGKFNWATKFKPWSSSTSSFPVNSYAPSAGPSSYYSQSSYGNGPHVYESPPLQQYSVANVLPQMQPQPQPQPQLQPQNIIDRVTNPIVANSYTDIGTNQRFGSTGFVAYYTIPVSDAYPLQPQSIIIGSNNDRTGAETDKILVSEKILKKNHLMNCD